MNRIRKKLYHNKRAFQSLCILVLITFFLGFFLFLYGQFQTATLQTLTTFNSEFIERVNVINTAMLNNINTSSMQMFYTSSINTLRTTSDLTNAQKIIGLRDLGNFVSSSDFMDSVMVYNSKLDTVFTSEGGHSSQSSADFHDSGAVEILTHPQNYPYLVPIKRQTGGKTCYSFLFFEYQNADSSTLLVNVRQGWYESRLLGMSETDSYLIINEMGEIIISDNETLSEQFLKFWPQIQKKANINPIKGFFLPPPFSDTPGWMYHHMSDNGWYYLKAIQLEAIAPGLIHIRNFLFVSFTLFSGVIIIASIYLLMKVYLPLHSIRDVLKQSGQDGQNLSTQVEQLIEHKKASTLIRKLSQLKEGVMPSSLSFPLLLLLSEEDSLILVRDMVKEQNPASAAAMYDRRILAAIPACSDECANLLTALIPNQFQKRFFISSLCHTSEDLIKSFAALEELCQLRFLYPNQQILFEQLLSDCNPASGFNSKEVTTLISALKSGQADTAYTHWDSILSSISRDRYVDFRFAVCYLDKQLSNLHIELELQKPSSIDMLLADISDIDELNCYFHQQFLPLADVFSRRKHEHLSKFAEQIEQYLHSHYMEDSFSAQQVAEYFGMNAAYLSRQYHQISGFSISDSINRVRIEHACQLLTDTAESAEVIAQRVGYGNSKYFFVLFKKWTGTTPKQYRNARTSLYKKPNES